MIQQTAHQAAKSDKKNGQQGCLGVKATFSAQNKGQLETVDVLMQLVFDEGVQAHKRT